MMIVQYQVPLFLSFASIVLSFASIASMAIVLLRYRTVLLGFTFFSFFNIASASLSGFLMVLIFNLSRSWITPSHIEVFIYTSLGLIAFSIGVWIAWNPLQGKCRTEIWKLSQHQVSNSCTPGMELLSKTSHMSTLPWLNMSFAILCLIISVIVYLLNFIFSKVPTLKIIWSTFYVVLPLGMLVAILFSQLSRNYKPLVIALLVFVPLVLLNAVTTGHIGAGGVFLFQLMLVASFALGVRVRTLFFFFIGNLFATSLIVGWMASRDIIRSNRLVSYGIIDRIDIFIRDFEYTKPLDLTPEQVQEVVRLRVDMSDILAAQVYYQPEFQPYAYGGTIFENLGAAMVPRFIWPEKPRFVGGSEFVSRYTGIDFGPNVSVGLPYQFELYANGGRYLVIIGLFCLGWLTASLERCLINGNYSLPQFMVLFHLNFAVANGGQTISSLIISIIAGTIGFYLLGKILMFLNHFCSFWRASNHLSSDVFVKKFHRVRS